MQNKRYPKIFIRSKNDLAKHISHKGFSKTEALDLINEVLKDPEKYWRDSKHSEPEKEKYVRNAKGTRLGYLLQKINTTILAPHDNLLPNFVFGGVSKASHVKAATYLLGKKRRRTLLKLDITRFFEQVSYDRVVYFFQTKCACDRRSAKLLADLCCVPTGPKGSGSSQKTVARGFATSSRLVVWCNLDTFIKLEHFVQKRLKGKDPRVAVYVDDIGITASRVSKEQMQELRDAVQIFLTSVDPHQKLPLNAKKTKILSHKERIEYVGLTLNRNTLSLGAKTLSKRKRLKNKLKGELSSEERSQIKRKYKSLTNYKKHVESVKV